MKATSAHIRAFRDVVWRHYNAHGRHALPWRETRDPYRILVSEVMLQQTQVERVIPYFTEWLTLFPDVRTLAKAPLSKVLRAWQGLGYNRRAKMLHEAAKAVAKEHCGVLPKSPEELEKLPGIGPYTARAVAAFAHNQDVVFIETNIRTAILHHFFQTKNTIIYDSKSKSRRSAVYSSVSDSEILKILERALPKAKEGHGAREWYGALMDYGSFLKRSGVRLNARAKNYTKQKKFQGSDREARGAILKALVLGPKSSKLLVDLFGAKRRGQARNQLATLTKEGLITLKGDKFRLPN